MRLKITFTIKDLSFSEYCDYARLSADDKQFNCYLMEDHHAKDCCTSLVIFQEIATKFEKIEVSIRNCMGDMFHKVIFERTKPEGRFMELTEGNMQYMEDRYVDSEYIIKNLERTGKYHPEKKD